MSDATKAVFLSYAREDTDAARRIAEALRGFGVEVWFDQSELRGGDAWDAKIKKQIRECALFLPVISEHTENRHEGYFRREWNLAVDRTLDMAHDATFIVPVVIDVTSDATARVPDRFRSVQWMRVPDGVPTPEFVAQVKRLLDRPAAGRKSEVGTLRQAQGAAAAAEDGRAAPAKRVSATTTILVGAFIGLVIAVAVWQWRVRPAATVSPVNPPSAAAKPPTDFAAAKSEAKSVAVLAFENLSGDKENEYFSDGISEELLNVLAKVPGLRVAARTSAFYFKGKQVPIGEVAKQLNVGYVVEGSVRKVGTQVRITAQLINAADGFHVWSDTFTRELKDIFALQDEIAGVIAKNLQLKLGDEPRIAKTVSPEAHRLVLEGRFFWNLRTDEGYGRAETAFKKALQIDPKFAEAHAGLAGVYFTRANSQELDGYRGAVDDMMRGREAASQAITLDPTLGEAYATLGFGLMLEGKLQESEQSHHQALALNPSSALTRYWYGLLLMAQGRLEESIAEQRKGFEFDPIPSMNQSLAMVAALVPIKAYNEALDVTERAAALRPDIVIPNLGDRTILLFELGRKKEALETARLIRQKMDSSPRWIADSHAITVLRKSGLEPEAIDFAKEAFMRLPPDSYVHGFILGALGRFDEAAPFLAHTPILRVRELYWGQVWDPWRNTPGFAQVMAKLGRTDEYKVARETLARMLAENQRAEGGGQRADKGGDKSK